MTYRTALALALVAVGCAAHGSDAASSSDAITASELPIVIADSAIVAGTFEQTIDHDT